jgi:hypothetical protein
MSILNKTEGQRRFAGDHEGANLTDWLNTLNQGPEEAFALDLLQAAKGGGTFGKMLKLLVGVSIRPAPKFTPDGERLIYWELVSPSALRSQKRVIDSASFPVGLADAIAAIVQLWQIGAVSRVIKCACGQWFFGKFERSTYCSRECQLKYARETEKFKRKHRDYMREYQRRRRAKRSGSGE